MRREPHPDDRRKLLVDITDEARRLVERMLPMVHATALELLDGVAEPARAPLMKALARVHVNGEAMGSRPVPAVTLRRRTIAK